MGPLLAVVAYRCTVDGVATESIDIQVRYFSSLSESEIHDFLEREETQSYENGNGERVEWPFVKVLAIEEFGTPKHGDEVVGFITGLSEISSWSENHLHNVQSR